MIVIICAVLYVMILTAISSFDTDPGAKTRGKIAYLLLVIWAGLIFSIDFIEKHLVTENVTEGD